jgi:hypothetical protein
MFDESHGRPSAERLSVGNANDFTVGKEKGVVVHDHRHSMVGTTLNNVLIDSADYSAFDAHQHYDNCRKYALNGLKRGLRLIGKLDQKYSLLVPVVDGPPMRVGTETFEEWIDLMWSESRIVRPVYETSYMGKTIQLTLDMLLSGEFITLNFNNMTNRALFRDFLRDYEAMLHYTDRFNLIRRFFQGDDSLGFWDVDWRTVSKHDMKLFVDTMVESAARNGQDLNALKTAMRFFRSEYLKKTFIYGMHVPLQIVQHVSSENENREFMLEQVSAYVSTLRTKVGRGSMSNITASMLGMATWALRRAVRITSGRSSFNYYMPFGIYFLPKSEGGLGMHPAGVIGANMDMVVTWFAHVMGEDDYLERMKAAVDTDATRVRRELAESLMQPDSILGDQIANGRKYMADIKSKWNGKFRDAKAALRILDSRGMSRLVPRGLNILNIDKTMLENVVVQNETIQSLRIRDKESIGLSSLRAVRAGVRSPLSTDLTWVKDVDLRLGDNLPLMDDELVLPVVDGANMKCLRSMGITTGRKLSFSAAGVLRILREDKLFPRHVREEDIINILSHPEAGQDIDLLIQTLVVIGARPDLAQRALGDVIGSVSRFAILQSATKISIQDSFMSNIAVNEEVLNRLSTVYTNNRTIEGLVKLLCMGVSMYLSRGRTLQHVYAYIKSEDLNNDPWRVYDRNIHPESDTTIPIDNLYLSSLRE